MFIALLRDLQVLHHHDMLHIERHLDLLGQLQNRAVWDVVLNDLHHAAFP